MFISLDAAIQKYGKIENGVWLDEANHCSILEVPQEINWINSATGSRAGHIYCNRDVQASLLLIFKEIVSSNLAHELETFDGCLMIRDVRGEPGKPSAHSYALAIDFNAASNKLGQPPTMSPEVVSIFKKHGWVWGGDFSRRDGMHYSFAWEQQAA